MTELGTKRIDTRAFNDTRSQSHQMVPPLPSSRWLGLQLPSSQEERPLSPTAAHQQGTLWLRAVPGDTLAALLLVSGHALWLEAPTSPRRALDGSLLWLRGDRLEQASLELAGPARHRALLLCYPLQWIRQHLDDHSLPLTDEWRELLRPTAGAASLLRSLEAEDRGWAMGLMAPSLCAAARRLVEGSRMSEFFFRKVLLDSQGREFFCHRTRRLALERVERVCRALKANLEAPPSLAELARLCGCNPQYLSRTFAETAGLTITHFLRKLRIEHAMTLMSRGTHNASEAALEVGYQSMSHFSVAFREVIGTTPSEWARRESSKGGQLGARREPRPRARGGSGPFVPETGLPHSFSPLLRSS